jgi:hypothetical protein
MLWSRRFVRGESIRVVRVDAAEVAIETDGKADVIATDGPGWSFVHAQRAMVKALDEGWDAADTASEHRFHERLAVTWDPTVVSHPAAEAMIGEALFSLDPTDPANAAVLTDAAPLLLVQWPVGYRFGAIFERPSPVTESALAAITQHLADDASARLPMELTRVCTQTVNAAALSALLVLVERGAPFDGWMDVIDLCAEVGDPQHAPTLKRLAKGRVAADIRQALLAVARELA